MGGNMIASTKAFSLRDWTRPVRHRLGAVLSGLGIVAPQMAPSMVSSAAPGARISYSGHGEDLVVWAWLSVEGRLTGPEIRYLDIGAAEPTNLNNTYLLSTFGARGVLVEPDPDQAAKLRAARPRDTTINVGVAFDERQSATLTRFTSPLFNTFSERQADVVLTSSKNWHPTQLQAVVDRIDVALVPINKILKEHGAPHFLSIDAESLDFQILKSIDFSQFRPWIICMEIMCPLADIEALLNPFGYKFICRTPDNVMFILNPLPSNPSMLCS
jgi:FkbM family methyltransferase